MGTHCKFVFFLHKGKEIKDSRFFFKRLFPLSGGMSLFSSVDIGARYLVFLFGANFSPKSHYAKRRFSVTSKYRYIYGVLNIDKIKN
jgi:hypothetical protein